MTRQEHDWQIGDMTKPRIGSLVRTAREQLGLSRERLAFKSDVSTAMIVRLEMLDKEPNPAALARIAAQLQLSVEELRNASSVHWYGKAETTTVRRYRIGRGGRAKPSPDDIPLDFNVPDSVAKTA